MSKLTKTGKRCTIRLTELEELVVSLSIPGSARHSHCRGQGFDSPMLHKEISHPLRVADFFMRTRGVRIPDFDIALNALERGFRRRPPVADISSAEASTEREQSPHCGDCFLSLDLSVDEIPATGGHRRFVPAFDVKKGFISERAESTSWQN